jgi:membrane protease YdiL (CAAX protease family)
MRATGLPGGLYVCYLLLWIPWLAFRSRKHLLSTPDEGTGVPTPIPSRTRILASTFVSLVLLFWLSWVTARSFGYVIFAVHAGGARSLLGGAAAFGLMLAMMFANRALRPVAERRAMPVYKLMPRTATETALYVIVALGAGVAEEAAYRGVLVQILWYAFGSPWPAVLISATAFAVAHAFQGWKSGVVIFVGALTMHALVWFTDTLVVAMVVDAVYDLVAGLIGAKRVARGEVEG